MINVTLWFFNRIKTTGNIIFEIYFKLFNNAGSDMLLFCNPHAPIHDALSLVVPLLCIVQSFSPLVLFFSSRPSQFIFQVSCYFFPETRMGKKREKLFLFFRGAVRVASLDHFQSQIEN